MTAQPILVSDCKSAEEFLAVLDGFRTDRYEPREWIFRGLGSESYLLVPAALRTKARLLDGPSKQWRTGLRGTAWEQIRDEIHTVFEFLRNVDASGLELPEDSQEIRDELWATIDGLNDRLEEWESGDWIWPPRPILSLVGIAQHYGVHTRLLDWTYDSSTAAYFAVREGAERFMYDDKADKVMVWALARRHFQYAESLRSRTAKHIEAGHNSLEIVTAPAAQNPNLRAQRGLFTFLNPPEHDPDESPSIPTLDSYVAARFKGEERPVLVKVMLPSSHASRVLRLLAHRFVTASSLNPGYPGNLAALEERRYWDQPG